MGERETEIKQDGVSRVAEWKATWLKKTLDLHKIEKGKISLSP